MARLNLKEQYNRAMQIAYFLIEGGHTVEDVVEEFRICKTTYQSDMRILATYGYGSELRQNQILYVKAKAALNNAVIQRRRKKRG